MAKDVTPNIANPQQIDFVAGGANDAKQIHICTGEIILAESLQDSEPMYFKVGPKFEPHQFIRAIISIGLTGVAGEGSPGEDGLISLGCAITDIDADWDDDSKDVIVRLLVRGKHAGSIDLEPTGLSYNVTILAKAAT